MPTRQAACSLTARTPIITPTELLNAFNIGVPAQGQYCPHENNLRILATGSAGPRRNRPGLDDIWQAIQIILRTPRGSDPHRPEFGSNLHLYIDWPIDRAIPHVVRESVDAIRRWEPRCQLMSVKPAVDGEHLTLRVSWKGSDGQPRTQELLWR